MRRSNVAASMAPLSMAPLSMAPLSMAPLSMAPISMALLLGVLVAGCQQVKPNQTGTKQQAASGAKTEPATADKQATPKKEQGHDEQEHDCTHGGGGKLKHTKVSETTGPDGKKVVHAGNTFAKDTETVAVADLLAAPDKYKGKTIRVTGNVSAMCHHRRGWFAIAAKASSGGFVRVITAPSFLVPEGSMGKLALAEGTVEVVDVNPGAAKHYAKDHKLGDPAKVQGTQKRVILRASGADFS